MPNEIKIIPAYARDFLARWKEVEPHLDRSAPVMLRRYEPVDIPFAMYQAEMVNPKRPVIQGWFAIENNNKILAVLVSQILQFPRRRCLDILCLGGERMEEWFDKGETVLTEYARLLGCDHFAEVGRDGWEKHLREKGFIKRGTVMVKEIVTPNDGGAM